MGKVERQKSTTRVDKGSNNMTNRIGACIYIKVGLGEKGREGSRDQRTEGKPCLHEWDDVSKVSFSWKSSSNEDFAAVADKGRTNSSVLERGDDVADQERECFGCTWNHSKKRVTTMTSIEEDCWGWEGVGS